MDERGWVSREDCKSAQERFSRNLRAALGEAGMKQVELCARTGLSRSTVNYYAAGSILPKVDTLEIIADGLGTTPGRLLGWPRENAVPKWLEDAWEIAEEDDAAMALLESAARAIARMAGRR